MVSRWIPPKPGWSRKCPHQQTKLEYNGCWVWCCTWACSFPTWQTSPNPWEIWIWEDPQKQVLDSLKDAMTGTPILGYFNVKEEVMVQCDASQFGLGAALLLNGQPIAYASRALNPAETWYAQIRKEHLAIVFACKKFDTNLYGLEGIKVESDHKPLEPIFLKPLHATPQWLQGMLLHLQRYSLTIQYKNGQHMCLADTLSQAPLPKVSSCEFVYELEEIDHKEFLPVSSEQWQQSGWHKLSEDVLNF